MKIGTAKPVLSL